MRSRILLCSTQNLAHPSTGVVAVTHRKLPVHENVGHTNWWLFGILGGGAVAHRNGIENDEVRPEAGPHEAPIVEPKLLRRVAGHLSRRFCNRKPSQFPPLQAEP